MMDKYAEINKVLMEWNPLSVVGPALSDEYVGLIPLILVQKNEINLEYFLKQTMSDQYGIEYEDDNEEGKREFQSIIKRIANILW